MDKDCFCCRNKYFFHKKSRKCPKIFINKVELLQNFLKIFEIFEKTDTFFKKLSKTLF